MFTQNQLTPVNRHIGNISAHKILSVMENATGGYTLIVACSDRISGGRLKIDVSEKFEVGEWVDLCLSYASCNGTICSHSVKYIGRTPDRFIPQDETRTWSK